MNALLIFPGNEDETKSLQSDPTKSEENAKNVTNDDEAMDETVDEGRTFEMIPHCLLSLFPQNY